MGRPKGVKNKNSNIKYPRKCNKCGYISNNPSMYLYHNRTHEDIPENKLCGMGCGQLAKYRNTNGTYTCTKISHQCPAYKAKQSKLVTKHWIGNTCRKEKTKEIFRKHCYENKKVRVKQKATVRAKYGSFTPDQMKDFRHYARRIRAKAQRWAKNNGYHLGQQTFHVDHKLSIWNAWKEGLSEDVVNHPVNLQVITATENSSKGSKSILTVDELLEATKNWT